ncbi:alpha/beta fold hydrolase [Candidatus Peregrinibacteria bacterium]|nr:alpha/beta fold hydrolase [Candidatus Peregrinibacteria bacterium]
MKPILLCLHGWGADHHSFDELKEALKDSDIQILTPDLPGFGKEPEPEKPWTTDDYAEWVMEWIKRNLPPLLHPPPQGEVPPQSFALLGHSHGGRIAIKLAAQNNLHIDHLFLCAAAGIRHPRHIKRAFGLTLAKTGKLFLSLPGMRYLQPIGKRLLYKLFRVHDYEQASAIMRQTMINVCKEDLRPLLKNIRVPTDIFWGEDDGMTPLADGQYMHEQIKGSHFYTYSNVRHRVHKDKAKEIADIIHKRLL